MSIDMSKVASGVVYGASAGTVANSILTRYSPDEWSAIGIIGGLVIAALGLVVTAFFKWRDHKVLKRALETKGYAAALNFNKE